MQRASRIRLAALGVAAALVVAVTALAASAVAGGTTAGTSRSAANEIRAGERALLRATVDADIAAARRLLADDFELINPLGGVQTGEEYLGAIAAGVLDFLAFEPVSAIEVRVDGRSAVTRFRSSIDLAAFGDRLTHEAWHSALWERRARTVAAGLGTDHSGPQQRGAGDRSAQAALVGTPGERSPRCQCSK